MQQPIGIFDSGIGGTSIWKEIAKLLPNEETIYLADSKNAPYGNKSSEAILALSIKNTELLLELGAKIIVVACNTATTNAIATLRARYQVPFIGIEPAIKPAALQTRTNTVGVLATKGTLTSALFHNTSKLHAAGIKVIEQEGKGLVKLIESGEAESKEMEVLLRDLVQPMVDQGIDCLVLGCTHYPYLIPLLKKVLPANVQIIDSGFAVAKQTKAILKERNLLNTVARNKVSHTFYTNTDVALLRQLVAADTSNIYFKEF